MHSHRHLDCRSAPAEEKRRTPSGGCRREISCEPDTRTACAVVGPGVDQRHAGGVVMAEDATSAPLAPRAQALTLRILARDRVRVDHSASVAAHALALAPTVPAADRDTLVAAAWLHDIGYATELGETGFHPLDGARYLQAQGWPARVCDLVAHHSGARFVAAVIGLGEQLSQFAFVEDAVSDALTVADQTTGPHGEALTLDQRLREKHDRHGPDSAAARAQPQRDPYLRAAADRVEQRLRLH